MPGPKIKLVTRYYDMVMPLLTRDVVPDGLDLEIDYKTSMAAFLAGDQFDAGELSISQYIRRIAKGDDGIIGLPIMLCRGFRHRSFFVRNGTDLQSLADLAGRRVGTNGWPDTGNTWGRSLIRGAGVDIRSIEWTIGPVDDWNHPMYGPPVVNMNGAPDFANPVPEGATLVDLLLDNQLDLIMVNRPPKPFLEGRDAVSRLFPSYRDAEAEYAAKVGFYPCSHIVGLRAEVAAEHPGVASILFDVFEESRKVAETQRKLLADTTPWVMDEFERVEEILGPDWQSHGVESNRAAMGTICDELYQQGIIARPVTVDEAFRRFQ